MVIITMIMIVGRHSCQLMALEAKVQPGSTTFHPTTMIVKTLGCLCDVTIHLHLGMATMGQEMGPHHTCHDSKSLAGATWRIALQIDLSQGVMIEAGILLLAEHRIILPTGCHTSQDLHTEVSKSLMGRMHGHGVMEKQQAYEFRELMVLLYSSALC